MADSDQERLKKSLERMGESLGKVKPPASRPASLAAGSDGPRPASSASPGLALVGVAIAMLGAGIAMSSLALVLSAIGVLVMSGVLLFTDVGRNLVGHVPGVPADPNKVNIGLGAEIAPDVVIEPGASVEMGADVGAGTVIREGATVRMGCTIGEHVVIERGAIISWGCDVHDGAVIEAGAVIGAGSTIGKNARVPAHARLLPGADFKGGTGAKAPTRPPISTELKVDPRHARIDTACDRLEQDFRQTPENLRSFLGDPANTIGSLRATCHDLLTREQLLRAETDPDALERLEEEKQVLTGRLTTTTDPAVRRSLEGALAAIADQQKQREHLKSTADRLDAEATRLVLTLEAMATQVVRMTAARAASTQASNPILPESVKDLHDQIEAVSMALEEIARQDNGLEPVAPISSPEDNPLPSSPERVKG